MVTTLTTGTRVWGPSKRKCSIILHAAAANTQTIQISSTDPTCLAEYEELLAGQSISFEGIDNAIYAASTGGAGQILTIPFIQFDESTQIVKS